MSDMNEEKILCVSFFALGERDSPPGIFLFQSVLICSPTWQVVQTLVSLSPGPGCSKKFCDYLGVKLS
jgi:hypothetical protein